MVSGSECKIDRVIEHYQLDDPQHASVDLGLVARWRGDDTHTAYGYRTLTRWFNKRVLRTVYEQHGRKTLGNRIESDYAALTGEDTLVQEEVMSDIETDGIRADKLVDDLVSWGTMRTHLKECLDAGKPTEDSSSEWQRDAIRTARSIAEKKAGEALSSLTTNGDLEDGDAATVDVEIRLRCGECPTTVPFDVAAQRGYICDTHRETAAQSNR